ncbi:MAG: substrate-binding domain-containing protein [Planctomycetota bacterium]|nr:substrate-binding domain-containing protein [Planctomycetota bacterium]
MPRSKVLMDKLLAELRRQLTAGFRPGEALPSQRALGDMHGVGQATVHRALALLADEGLVEARARSGWFRAGAAAPARSGRGKRAGLRRIGLITRRSAEEWRRKQMRLYEALLAEAARRGLPVVMHTNPRLHHPTPARNRLELSRVPWNEFDAALLVELEDAVTLADPLLKRHPVLAVDQDARLFGLPSVSFDEEAIGRQAARHLLDLGHRRFAVTDEVNLGGWPAEASWMARRHSFEFAVGRHGGTIRPEWRVPSIRHGRGESAAEAGARLARQWQAATPEQRPTALFAIDTQVLGPLLDALAGFGWQTPRDLSVVTATWDEPPALGARGRPGSQAPAGRFANFSTVYLDLPMLARRAFDAAEDLVRGAPPFDRAAAQPPLIASPVLLVPGESTAAPGS